MIAKVGQRKQNKFHHSKGTKCFKYCFCFVLDTEEASESEYGHTTRNPNEPLEIKEL